MASWAQVADFAEQDLNSVFPLGADPVALAQMAQKSWALDQLQVSLQVQAAVDSQIQPIQTFICHVNVINHENL